MSKNFLFKLLIGIIIVASPVLWLLSLIIPETFGWFNASYAVALASGGIGALLILRGVFKKDNALFKKVNIWLGAGLLVVTLFSLVSAIALPKNWIIPIICVIAGVALILGILATGGKSWDTADNQKVGYKNYHQRKKEEEKQNNKNDKT